jgi:bifunctional NMN adenylyltransferase/nudix hydrolase
VLITSLRQLPVFDLSAAAELLMHPRVLLETRDLHQTDKLGLRGPGVHSDSVFFFLTMTTDGNIANLRVMTPLQPVGQKADIGVIIGRFQVDALHQGHINLLDTVSSRHHKVIILLGVARVPGERDNALDFDCRRLMIQEKYPEFIVLPLPDCRTNEEWSKNVDSTVRTVAGPGQSVILYGGRDSCLPCYSGKFKIQELEDPEGTISMSGTAVRNRLAVSVQASQGFRAGAIWEAHQSYPRVITTVDVAIVDKEKRRVLLARKPGETQWRFVGGFSEPKSASFESDAKREAMEETGLEISDLVYLGSFNVPDWRMKRSVNQIRTLFFAGTYTFGGPKANDDIEEVRWFAYDELYNEHAKKYVEREARVPLVVPEHKDLFLALLNFIKRIDEDYLLARPEQVRVTES